MFPHAPFFISSVARKEHWPFIVRALLNAVGAVRVEQWDLSGRNVGMCFLGNMSVCPVCVCCGSMCMPVAFVERREDLHVGC